ncbi:M24 family metallopeptidase [Oceanispirochaeta sp.]|uniref:M24 family metallopeptidase n=1 Tax=Oceanispirochaeta sp. TaxID=2035350 RepID=UPI002611D131|nr:M24 family metallopeptidase [Oceanispirochaeta sp.]MDA3956151.1 M24 family metallopeptidase [Oceanispirochaeta sp.]
MLLLQLKENDLLTSTEIQIISDLSLYLHDCLLILGKGILPGVRGTELQRQLEQLLIKKKSRIHGASFDINVNHRVCHGPPNDSKFRNNDIVTLDLVFEKDGLFADSAWTFICGDRSPENEALLQKAWDVSRRAYCSIRTGGNSLEMKKSVHKELTGTVYELLEEACGHGIGKSMHEPPDFSYSLFNNNDIQWNPGMVLTIEPVIAYRGAKLICSKEKEYYTDNKSPSAYFEHMVAINENGPQCLNIPQIKDQGSIDIFSEII